MKIQYPTLFLFEKNIIFWFRCRKIEMSPEVSLILPLYPKSALKVLVITKNPYMIQFKTLQKIFSWIRDKLGLRYIYIYTKKRILSILFDLCYFHAGTKRFSRNIFNFPEIYFYSSRFDTTTITGLSGIVSIAEIQGSTIIICWHWWHVDWFKTWIMTLIWYSHFCI